jgi:hypothetical protein
MGTAPVWGIFAWNADTPSDSHIDFNVSVAQTFEELSGTPGPPTSPLLFSQPPGPMALAGTAIGVHRGNSMGPNTQQGATLIDATLVANIAAAQGMMGMPGAWARDAKALRLRAHLVPSSNFKETPTLQAWNLQISCQPAE